MLDVVVRFAEKDATVRYVPAEVSLSQILKQYESTPFGVSPKGSVVTVARSGLVTLRGWTNRQKSESKDDTKSTATDAPPKPIQLFIETVVKKSARATAEPEFSLAGLGAMGLAADGAFERSDTKNPTDDKLLVNRFVVSLYESVALKPGDSRVPVNFKIRTTDASGKRSETSGRMQVVVRTPRRKSAGSAPDSKGIALIDGRLDLQLGHLCNQRGCVEHFHKSLSHFASLGAVAPRASLEQPGATLYLRAGQAIDVWSLRERLRDESIEISGIMPRQLSGYRLHVELPRWESAEPPAKPKPCLSCRGAVARVLESSPWVQTTKVTESGITFTPKQDDVDLARILDRIADAGVAPQAVWLAPVDVAIPNAAPPRATKPDVQPKSAASQSHPVVEIEFAHKCDAGPTVSAMIGRPSWASELRFDSDKNSIAQTWIGDRKHASLSPLLSESRSAGRLPKEIRLRRFGDVRIYLEFAHICGDIVYSKPPKPKKKPVGKNVGNDKKAEEKPKKAFVARALHPADSSNGRKAIKAAIESVPWIQDAVFFDYHTKFQFQGGPRKVMIAFQPKVDDFVRLDQMIDALRNAGFPPKSVMVSRRFSGIPFTAPLPGELLLADQEGNEQTLSSLKRQDRPLALAFVSLNCKRHKKYKADPKLYGHLNATINKYRDRVDFVSVAANPDDKFEDVAAFLKKTGLPAPLQDVKGQLRAALNAQETPAPHFYIFDGNGLFRYAGDPHDNWEKPAAEKDDYLARALDVVLSGKFAENGAAFFNKSVCNCSHPKCKCPKCGCGPSCRCGIKH